MAKFTEKIAYYGFDPKRPWQMVPVGGGRYVFLEDGANMKVRLKERETMKDLSPSVAVFQEMSAPNQNKREFGIWGYQEGKALLHAEDSGKSAKLQIRILPTKITEVDFYLLSDRKNKTKANSSEFPTLIAEANFFLQTQTNVWIQKRTVYDLYVDYDFGNIIDVDVLIRELKDRFPWTSPNTPSVILTWKYIKRKNYPPISAFTKPPFIILEDPGDDTSLTFRSKIFAHELCHYFIGPDHREGDENKHNLLHKDYIFGDSKLDRVQIVSFNKNKFVPWE